MSITKDYHIGNLEPKILWENFQKLCAIPRPSHHEEKISQFLKDFGLALGLETTKDNTGNVIIRKPATSGLEHRKTILLQTHMDMVPQKELNKKHNFQQDPIEAYVDGDWVKANGTTLGADNGIGIAAVMSILAMKDIVHGPIEALFTICEEDGMNGANALESGILKSDILLNLDAEEDGVFYVGCAGGINTDANFHYKTEFVSKNYEALKLSITGLKGGHSGLDIHLGRGNAIKILSRFLWVAIHQYQIQLAEIEGGSFLHNAIPRDAHAIFAISSEQKDNFLKEAKDLIQSIKNEFASVDSGLTIELTPVALPHNAIEKKVQNELLNALSACPHGILDMSPEVEGLVRTSTNLSYVKSENGNITIYTLQRGSVDSIKMELAQSIYSIFELAGAEVKFTDPYPGWDPNLNSPILKEMEMLYEKEYGEKPQVVAVHAGLECGLIGSKYPDMDMISFGPTIKFAHSPDEKANIPSVQKFWNFLLLVLKEAPKK